MKIGIKDLPSKGLGSKYNDIIDLDLLTYYDVMKYVSSENNSKSNSMSQLLRDIQYILAPRVPYYKDLSSYDLNFLISLRKLYSVLKDDSTFTLMGKVHNLSSIQFTEIEENIMRVSHVMDKPFKIATVGEVESTIVNTPHQYQDLGCELAILAADMGCAVEDILSVSSRDTATVEFIKTKIVSNPMIGGEEGVVLFGKSSDLFRSLLESQSIDQLKIRYTEVLPD